MHGAHLHPAPDKPELNRAAPSAILLDIEGTTTPIEFVHQVLFPYARARVRDYLRQDASDVALLASEHAAEAKGQDGLPPWQAADAIDSAEKYVYWLMDRDRKSTGLKSLQGKIWEAGYRAGELQGRAQVYPDVAPALARWRAQGKDLAIFSSGSVQAQRNLFANASAGDLTPFLRDYFDTTTGPKREPESYRRIAQRLGLAPKDVLFISDTVAELDAARTAEMDTRLCVRSTQPGVRASVHRVIHSFDEV